MKTNIIPSALLLSLMLTACGGGGSGGGAPHSDSVPPLPTPPQQLP